MKDCRQNRSRNPMWGFGTFLVAFGLLLAMVMTDLLHLGEPSEYVKWQILLIFIGVVSFFNGKVGEALILFAVGVYFLLPHLDIVLPEVLDNFYWPSAIIIVGVGLIISGLIRNLRKDNKITENL